MKIILFCLFFTSSIMLSSCTKCSSDKTGATNADSSNPETAGATGKNSAEPGAEGAAAGKLQIDDEVIGTGALAEAGKKVTVHYTGTLVGGKKFDSSKDRNRPFSFDLGAGKVIKGWDEGVVGMKVGGKRKLIIPASMGYKERGVPGVIPPNSVLLFDVELLEVE